LGRDNESRIPIIKGYLLPVMAQAVVVARDVSAKEER